MADIFRAPVVQGRKERSDIPAALGVVNLLVTTLAVVAAAVPFNNASAFPTQANTPQSAHLSVVDTSRGTPKTLTADKQLPVRNSPPTQLDRIRPVTDTSASTSASLRTVVVPPPFTPIPHWAPLRFWWQPADTTLRQPKVLFGDAQAPVFNPAQFLVERTRQSPETSQGTPASLALTTPPAPIKNPVQFAPDRIRPVIDTTKGTPKTLTADAQLPFRTRQITPVDTVRAVVSTPWGTPQTLSGVTSNGSVTLTGAASTWAAGAIGVTGAGSVTLTGAASTWAAGAIGATGAGSVTLTGTTGSFAANPPTAVGTTGGDASVTLSGASAAFAANLPTAAGTTGSIVLALVGNTVYINQGSLRVPGYWAPVNVSNSAAWTPVDDSNSATWIPVDTR